MIKKRKISVITGSRAEYGILKSTIKAIKDHPKLELNLMATGMHLMPEFGYTVKEIEKDFKVDVKVEIPIKRDIGAAVGRSIGYGIINITEALEQIKPDIVVVPCDRSESLAAAIATAYLNIPIAHIHGGDSAKAGLDECNRHAMTKFANIHFAVTKKSAERIRKMGEDEWRIYNIGSPSLDNILDKDNILPKEYIEKKYNVDLKKPMVLAVQHSVSTQTEKAGEQMMETMDAILEFDKQTILLYPNSDAGGREIIKIIKKYGANPILKIYNSVPYLDYINIMRYASVMVGNSSSGIIEASSLHLPVVNIGTRQENREHVGNIINVLHGKKMILKALKRAVYDDKFIGQVANCKNPYGDGRAGKTIADILSEVEINEKLIQKKITY